jgi:hypothetical protein
MTSPHRLPSLCVDLPDAYPITQAVQVQGSEITCSRSGIVEEDVSVSVERLRKSPRKCVAAKEPSRHGPFAVRWLMRYLQEQDPTIDEIARVVGSLVALSGRARRAALSALRDLT